MLHVSDGWFRNIAKGIAGEYPDITFYSYMIDDFLCRMIFHHHDFDVVVMSNRYGDITSDSAAGLIHGIGP